MKDSEHHDVRSAGNGSEAEGSRLPWQPPIMKRFPAAGAELGSTIAPADGEFKIS
jgi:hypothetical protein